MGPSIVVAAVIRRGEQYLICRRPANKANGGLWEFPGGKVNPGESIEGALTREITEELGVHLISPGRVLYVGNSPESAFEIHFVEATISGEPIQLEHERFEWVLLEQFDEYRLSPIDSEFTRYLLNR